MEPVSREELKHLLRHEPDIALIETLPAESYNEYHLPGAINVPVDDDFEAHIQQAVPDKNCEVIVYCMDTECQASITAAKRMEKLGYKRVHGYEAGKVDWKAAGLPTEPEDD